MRRSGIESAHPCLGAACADKGKIQARALKHQAPRNEEAANLSKSLSLAFKIKSTSLADVHGNRIRAQSQIAPPKGGVECLSRNGAPFEARPEDDPEGYDPPVSCAMARGRRNVPQGFAIGTSV